MNTPGRCAYCGLPAPAGDGGEAYCCYGCRFAAEVTRARGESGQALWALTRLGLALFFTLNVTVFTMALWTQDFYGAADDGAWLVGLRGLFRYLSFFFAVPVLFLLGGPLLENALAGLRRGILATDLLLVLGVVASYFYSSLSLLRDDGPVYFEVGCTVLVLVTLGRWLEATGKIQTTAAVEALQKLLPETVRVLRAGGEAVVPLAEAAVGERLRVLAGERIPCDGRVVGQAATVEEQILTGESRPGVKEPGDAVHGGALNLDGDLVLEVTAPAGSGTLARMIDLVREALQAKGHYQQLADRVSSWFLPAVVLVALAAAGTHGSLGGVEHGILTGLAVVLIACPCALGLATPMAVWTAVGRAAGQQVLFRGGAQLERLAEVKAVRLDKTGTLTTGRPVLRRCATAEGVDPGVAVARAAGLAAASPHGHAVALREYAERQRISPETPTHTRTLPGRGLVGDFGDSPLSRPPRSPPQRQQGAENPLASAAGSAVGSRPPRSSPQRQQGSSPSRRAWLGSPRLMAESGLAFPDEMQEDLRKAEQSGQPLTCVGWGDRVRGLFLFEEQLRPEAAEALQALGRLGLDLAVLTGDHAGRGAVLARELGVPVQAGLLPEDKVAAVARAQEAVGPVAMVGDGINDAPALARSDVGFALGCGADVSRDSAAVCLLGNDLLKLPWSIALARHTVRVIRQNLFWAFAYNVLGIGLACTGQLNPVWAALAMVLSSLFVVGNSLRLRDGDA